MEMNIRKNVLSSVAAFVTNIVLVFFSYRLVVLGGGLEALGLWSTLMAWVYVIRLGDVGMANAAIRYVARCDSRLEALRIRRYVDTGILLNGALFFCLSLLGYLAFSCKMSHILPDNIAAQVQAKELLPILFAGFFLSNLSGLILGALRGIHKGYMAAWLTIAGTIAQLVIVVLLVPRVGLAGLAWGQLGQHGLILIVGWAVFQIALQRDSGWAGSWLPTEISGHALREMFAFSVKAQIANLTNGLFEPLSKIMIGRFAGLEVLGLYEMAYKMVTLSRNAIVSGVQATIPAVTRLMETDKTAARVLYEQSLRTVMRSGAIVLIGVVLGSPIVSWLWLGAVDKDFLIFVALMALGFLVNTSGAPAYTLGMASGRMSGNILSGLLSLGLLLILGILSRITEIASFMVLATAIATAFGGVFIRLRNELLLREKIETKY
ncbi:MAG: O-antigen/teichoic acid export membrane protein [Parvibaculaceae bacterium]|jgi:O-antigen/teichoic acid export membrane protein